MDDSQFFCDRILLLVDKPGCFPVAEFFNGKMLLRRFTITEQSPIFRSRIVDFTDADFPWPFLIVGLIRDGRAMMPKGQTVMEKNDIIYVLLPSESIAEFITFINPIPQPYESIIFYGSSFVAQEIAQKLSLAHKKFTILEEIKEEKKNLKEIFMKSNLMPADIFIAASDNKDKNKMMASCAKQLGVKITIAMMFNQEASLFHTADMDYIISKQDDFSKRAPNNQPVFTIKELLYYNIHLTECVVQKGSLAVKNPLKDLDIPPDCLIGSVMRGEKIFLAKGDTQFCPSDRVMIFSIGVCQQQCLILFSRKRLFRKPF